MARGRRPFSLGLVIDAIPYCGVLFRICRRYVDHCNGDNNGDMARNGELRWLKEVVPECHTVFDVGANVGDWADLALELNPALEVHCFEPCSSTFRRLQARKLAGSHLNCLGLSDSPGEATVYTFGNDAGTNSLYRREGLNARQQHAETVRLDTLDNYCERMGIGEIDILKLDVEGHEFSVLKGATRMLGERRIKHIQFEYGGTYIDSRVLLRDIFSLLQGFRYRLYKMHGSQLRPIDLYEQRLENFQYSNWVASR